MTPLKNKFVNVHIPKTAGSTFRKNMAWSLGPEVQDKAGKVLGIDQPKEGLEYFEGLSAAFADRLPELFQDGLQVISGHYRYRDIADLIAPIRDEISLVTFVRDPIWRTLSDYFYCISDRHDTPEAFLVCYPTLGDYLKNEGEMHKQLEYLRPAQGASVVETMESVISNFDFIGVTERFDADFADLMTSAGLEYKQTGRENVNPNPGEALEAYQTHKDQMNGVLKYEIDFYNAILEYRNLKHRN